MSPKRCDQTHGDNFVKSQPIFKILLPLEREEILSIKLMYHFPATPQVCCCTTFENLKVQILSKIWKKMQTKMSHEPVKFPQLSEDNAMSKL